MNILNVLKLVRPRHLLKALFRPFEEIEAFKYHYRRVSAEEFVEFLAREGGKPSAAEFLPAAARGAEFHSHLERELRQQPGGYGGQMTREAPAVYALVRAFRPEIVVETGVADGFTSSFILRAMEDNGLGKLYSIDLPRHSLPPGKSPGWLVDDRLRKRWDLRIGDAAELLPPLLRELGDIDMFLHDSLHTHEHMLLEFRSAWPHLKAGGLLLSHDVGQNRAFFEFLSANNIPWSGWRVFHVLGGFIKPPDSGRKA